MQTTERGGSITCLLFLAVGFINISTALHSQGLPHELGDVPASGRLIDLGGYKLHLDCIGRGLPTVVLSAGAGDFSSDWSLVQSEIAKFTRVCSYDRGGTAWSDLGPKPRTTLQEAFDLDRLLKAGGERGPYLMAGHSIGGLVVRLFAEAHTADVVGIVLVDAYSEDEQVNVNGTLQRIRLNAQSREIPKPRSLLQSSDKLTPKEIADIQSFMKQFVGEPKIEAPFDKLPKDAQRLRLWGLGRLNYYSTDDDYLAEISAKLYSEDQTKPHSLGSMPLVVLTRTEYDYPPSQREALVREHKDQQARLVALSAKGHQVIVPNSGHHIQIDSPGQVVDTVRRLVSKSRESSKSKSNL
jgi:pimeloyl-ACP methyl ester carboxylesterase